MSELFGFALVESNEDEISSLSIGASHGGIIAVCSEREYPTLSADDIKENGFYVIKHK